MHSAYFLTKDANNQFHYFSALCCWLLLQCDENFIGWSEFDPPDMICNSIIQETKNISSRSLSINPQKLRPGFGGEVLLILNTLCDCALLVKKKKFKFPTYPKSKNRVEEDIVDEFVECEMDDLPSDPEISEDEIQNETPQNLTVVTKVDPKAWELELEKVSSKLRVKNMRNHIEWRAHFFKAQKYSKSLKGDMGGISQRLLKIQRKLKKQIQRIRDKEQYVNENLSEIKGDFSMVYQQKETLNEQYEMIHNSVQSLSEDLESLTKKIAVVKSQSNKHNESMTDTSGIQNMRQTIKSMKEEIEEMVVRCSIQQFSVLRSKINEGRARAQA